ncbi:MAG: YbjQ family protein [Butyricicoccus pullicaecorum]|nr:YbjQ family protein [Butyricicoccus pullicaecorum]
MLLTTIETLPEQKFTVLGMVRGSTVQCKNFGRDFMAGLKNLVGGEMYEYTELMDETRRIATDRMIQDAERLGADAVIGMRYSSSEITQGAAEILAYGTAVKFL